MWKKNKGKSRKKGKKENEDKKIKKGEKSQLIVKRKEFLQVLKKKKIEKKAQWQKHVLPQYIFPACK